MCLIGQVSHYFWPYKAYFTVGLEISGDPMSGVVKICGRGCRRLGWPSRLNSLGKPQRSARQRGASWGGISHVPMGGDPREDPQPVGEIKSHNWLWDLTGNAGLAATMMILTGEQTEKHMNDLQSWEYYFTLLVRVFLNTKIHEILIKCSHFYIITVLDEKKPRTIVGEV